MEPRGAPPLIFISPKTQSRPERYDTSKLISQDSALHAVKYRLCMFKIQNEVIGL